MTQYIIGDIVLHRPQDHALLGKITGGVGAFKAARNRGTYAMPCMRGPMGILMDHDSLDAAVHWIEANPYMPDPATAPQEHGVYGPRLATWGALRIRGCVHAVDPTVAQGLGHASNVGTSALLAMDAHGTIVGRMTQTRSGWTIVVATDTTPRRCSRGRTADALDAFRTQVIRANFHDSRHHTMEILEQTHGFQDIALAFLDARDALCATQTQVAPPATPMPVPVEGTTLREINGKLLGMFGRDETFVRTTRNRPYPQSREHATFDEALAWLQSTD